MATLKQIKLETVNILKNCNLIDDQEFLINVTQLQKILQNSKFKKKQFNKLFNQLCNNNLSKKINSSQKIYWVFINASLRKIYNIYQYKFYKFCAIKTSKIKSKPFFDEFSLTFEEIEVMKNNEIEFDPENSELSNSENSEPILYQGGWLILIQDRNTKNKKMYRTFHNFYEAIDFYYDCVFLLDNNLKLSKMNDEIVLSRNFFNCKPLTSYNFVRIL